ncbi:uncharacterized protein LOC132054312 [Lycium ferocissimum]|uniref:uncharacterized protein LOC132054312 n=1 Tax=Lycium ferocissimum TaxID=112874 RepID=UPI002815BD7D|nr:uncharacterized protein LOC132054312 [Lycium ferocissimum]
MSSNPYVPPKGQSNEHRGYKLETMLERVLANQEKSEKTLKGLTKTVGSHTASIQKLESQMRDISREQYPPQKGGLPSDTVPNPKSGGGDSIAKCHAITTQSGKLLQGAGAKAAEKGPIEEAVTEVPFEVPSEVEEVQDEISNVVEVDPVPDVPKAQNRLVKRTEDAKCRRFYDQLKQLSMNIPFLDTFQEMPGFAKYLKYLLNKKRLVKRDTVSVTHHVSSVISTTRVQKKEDPGAFIIPCTVSHHDFARALCDNGDSINLMSLSIYRQSWLGMPIPTSMQLQMAD